MAMPPPLFDGWPGLCTLTADMTWRWPADEPEAPDGFCWLPPGDFPKKYAWLQCLAEAKAIYLTYKRFKGKVLVRVYVPVKDSLADSDGVAENHKLSSALMQLIQQGNSNLTSWHRPDAPFLPLVSQERVTLAALYGQIPSPTLDIPSCADRYASAFQPILQEAIEGFKSTLYHYQRRSVCTMLRHELAPTTLIDPAFLSLHNGALFFNRKGHTFHDKSRIITMPRGGILSEEMGVGKTCECLALIVATLGDLPANPADAVYRNIRHAPRYGFFSKIEPPRPKSSLLQDVCARSAAEGNINVRAFSQAYPHLMPLLRQYNQGYVVHPDRLTLLEATGTSPLLTRKTRTHGALQSETILLTTGTLVVVPDSLVSQWQHEMAKHIEQGILEVLVLAASKKQLATPDPATLRDYDLVLMSHTRFSQEDAQQESKQVCRCAYTGRSRSIQCTCPHKAAYKSPLMRLHWLRLIVDEGHTMSHRHTRALRFASALRAERRWVVSGTPSRGLTGTLSDGLELRLERTDMEELGVMLSEYLHLDGYSLGLWREQVATPFLGGQPGMTQVVRSILEAVMVRNRPDDIAHDVVLPHLTHRVVFLDPSPETALSLNIFNALVAINAVTSQRVDQDYFFHKTQAGPLAALVRNLLISTFWWTGTSAKDVHSAQNVAIEALKKHIYPAEDVELMQRAIEALQQALDSSAWQAMSATHELGYTLNTNLPDDLEDYLLAKHMPRLAGGSALAMAQQSIVVALRQPAVQTPDDHLLGHLVSAAIKHKARKQPAVQQTTEETLKKRAKPLAETPIVTLPDTALLRASSLSRWRITATSSAKLNYLLSQVLQYAATDKILIFSDFVDHSFHIAEALDLLHIPNLIYASRLPAALKSQYVMTFNTSQQFRVMVMDLRLAAHGLNLSSATRVYFVQQVWSRAIESQAIKRAHRIGQTRPVVAETLVLRGTLEEAMARRRETLRGPLDKVVTEDQVMRQAVQNPQFLPLQAQQCDLASPSLFAGVATQMPLESPRKAKRSASPGSAIADEEPKKRRTVAFNLP